MLTDTELAVGMATDTISLRKQKSEIGYMDSLGLEVIRIQPLAAHET